MDHYGRGDIAGLKFYSMHCLHQDVSAWDCQWDPDGNLKIKLPLKKYVFRNAPLYVWIYAWRYLSSDGTITSEITPRPFIVRVGTTCVRISSESKEQYPVVDAAVTSVVGKASIRPLEPLKGIEFVALPKQVDPIVLQPYTSANGAEHLVRDTQTQLSKIHSELKETNIPADHLDRFMFLTVNQVCGQIPMWMFPLIHLQDGTDATYLENLLDNAKFFSGIKKPANHADYAELLNEMQTMAVRNQLYVVDCSKRCCGQDILVDDWTNPLQYEKMANLGALDCEDAAIRMMQEAQMLRQLQPQTTNSILSKLRETEMQYVTFFCGMTLYLPPKKQWVYHAACLKLDRNYVKQQLGLKTDESKFLPPVLLEGTAYTTGCWDFKTSSDRIGLLDRSQVRLPRSGVESSAKVYVEYTKSHTMYGEIQTLISPELFYSYGIAQIELSYNKALAAPVNQVLEYSKQVKFHTVKIPPNLQTRTTLAEMRSMLPTPVLPKLRSKQSPVTDEPKKYICCFRLCEYDPHEFAKAMKTDVKQMNVRRIVVDDFLEFMCVYE